MMNRFPYNTRKCSSASSLSTCIHRFLAKRIITLPTKAKVVELFEQTLIGGFSFVNACLTFGSKTLLPKDEENKANQKLKLIYRIRNVITKIIKMNENNQYGNVMTKPLPTARLKKVKPTPTLRKFELILQSISITRPLICCRY